LGKKARKRRKSYEEGVLNWRGLPSKKGAGGDGKGAKKGGGGEKKER